MHLMRVQVPDFRGLKDIDISFEKDFFPKIFPLGSQNGIIHPSCTIQTSIPKICSSGTKA